MDDFAIQLETFRTLMTEDAYRRLGALQQLDGAMTEVDGQLLEYLQGMLRRHSDRRGQILHRLLEEAARYQTGTEAVQERAAVAQDGDLRAPRVLGGGEMQVPLTDENDGAHDRPENWDGFRGPYEGWRQ